MTKILFGIVLPIGWLVIITFAVTVKLLNKDKRPDYIPQSYRGMAWRENANSWWFLLKAIPAMGVMWTLLIIFVIIILRLFNIE
ncbi:MAG: hypothetical protein ABH954_04125 [Candidatus Omnitrophota bacterium]